MSNLIENFEQNEKNEKMEYFSKSRSKSKGKLNQIQEESEVEIPTQNLKTTNKISYNEKKSKLLSKITSPNIVIKSKPINCPKNNDDTRIRIDLLESFYTNLGHDYYTKILKIFEKYCFYGKLNTSFEMDFSQFTTFLQQNKMYDSNIDKTSSELIFNKIKGQNKCKFIFISSN